MKHCTAVQEGCGYKDTLRARRYFAPLAKYFTVCITYQPPLVSVTFVINHWPTRNFSSFTAGHTQVRENPSVCVVCGKAFSKRNLKLKYITNHLYSAPRMWFTNATTGQRPCECHLCNKGFVKHFWTPIRKAMLFSSRSVPSDYSVCTPITSCNISGFWNEIVEIFSLFVCYKV
jgi:hypothetical protein